jgi:predicted SAM-dependent methyltransferase
MNVTGPQDGGRVSDTEIVYVPGAENHYKYEHDVVVLDERLKDYPKAHEHIKNHELEHAKHGKSGGGFVALLRLEFQSDVDYHFGDSEAIEEVKDYLETERKQDRRHPAIAVKFSLVYFLRKLWDLALLGLSWVSRRF